MEASLLVIPLFILHLSITANGHGLKVGYYRQTCPEAEEIINETVVEAAKSDSAVSPALIRLHFHDCFVRGCDGSVLINSTADNKAEKDSFVNNLNPIGNNVIDVAKSKLEAKCPGVVSCADILAYAARDGAYQARRLFWAVEGGRRDGRISLAYEPPGNLPCPSYGVDQLTQLFASKNLSQEDMVTLSGAHSIGVSHCGAFSVDRLYYFKGSSGQDPSMNCNYALQLKNKCPPSASPDMYVELDPFTPTKLDVQYYVNLEYNLGLLHSDQALMSDEATSRLVKIYAKYPSIWRENFGRAMVKMGAIDVLTGSQGEIRKKCRFPN